MGIAVEVGLGTPASEEPDYSLYGFGKNVTGAGPTPATTYTVTNAAETGTGTWHSIVNVSPPVHDCLIQFAVSSAAVYTSRSLGSNVTIDGFANGQNGVTLVQNFLTDYKDVIFEDPCQNVLIRGIRFQGVESADVFQADCLAFDGTNGASIVGIALDRCTFMGAGDGGCDITGNCTDVTMQRCLLYGTNVGDAGGAQLIKYNTRQRITLWGNVYVESGGLGRCPQIHGECDPFEFVNNIVQRTGWHGMDVRGVGASEKPTGNIRGNYFSGSTALILSEGTYTPDVYVNGNSFVGGASDPGSPRGSEVAITSGYQITPLSAAELEAEVLDKVGAPNYTARDLEIIAAVRALLP
jgi:hypothetical protein